MEKFAVDLDKVLDDFEESEDKAAKLAKLKDCPSAVLKSTTSDVLPKLSLYSVRDRDKAFGRRDDAAVLDGAQELHSQNHMDRFDLSEANFAVGLKSLVSPTGCQSVNTNFGSLKLFYNNLCQQADHSSSGVLDATWTNGCRQLDCTVASSTSECSILSMNGLTDAASNTEACHNSHVLLPSDTVSGGGPTFLSHAIPKCGKDSLGLGGSFNPEKIEVLQCANEGFSTNSIDCLEPSPDSCPAATVVSKEQYGSTSAPSMEEIAETSDADSGIVECEKQSTRLTETVVNGEECAKPFEDTGSSKETKVSTDILPAEPVQGVVLGFHDMLCNENISETDIDAYLSDIQDVELNNNIQIISNANLSPGSDVVNIENNFKMPIASLTVFDCIRSEFSNENARSEPRFVNSSAEEQAKHSGIGVQPSLSTEQVEDSKIETGGAMSEYSGDIRCNDFKTCFSHLGNEANRDFTNPAVSVPVTEDEVHSEINSKLENEPEAVRIGSALADVIDSHSGLDSCLVPSLVSDAPLDDVTRAEAVQPRLPRPTSLNLSSRISPMVSTVPACNANDTNDFPQQRSPPSQSPPPTSLVDGAPPDFECSLCGPNVESPMTSNLASLDGPHFLASGSLGQSMDNVPKYSPPEISTDFSDASLPLEFGVQAEEGESTQGFPEQGEEDSLSGSLPDLSLKEDEKLLGKVKPFWVPDTEAPTCMNCDARFTVIKRRHHCRTCGKVFCSQCCSQKARLVYLDNKEARVCQQCLCILNKVSVMERVVSSSVPPSPMSLTDGMTLASPRVGPSSAPTSPGQIAWPPNPNNPLEYCSTVPPLEQAQDCLNCPPPTVMVPVGVLKRGDKPRGEPKQVIFSDGIRPGGDLTELDGSTDPRPPYRRQGRIQRRVADFTLDDKPDSTKLFQWLEDEEARPISFALTKNLQVTIKILKLDCCINHECWCFTSVGLCNVGQDEVMLVLQRMPDEKSVPADAFRFFNALYDSASKGITVGHMGHTLFPEGLFDSREHSGFLFIRPTLQCLKKLVLPSPPCLVALLIQRWEVPWAKVFPLRLMLRLGAEFRYYPCPLISVRFRKPVFGEVGHTVMSVLADFRNYQYTLPFVPGLVIHMEDKKTYVRLPHNSYEHVMKVVNNSNDHVLPFGANFNNDADSHLVCMQNDDGNYHTQAINIQNTPCKVTGASFIVFSGALKAATKRSAKSSIVEDGLLVQIPPETMVALRSALREMKDFTVSVGAVESVKPDEIIALQWHSSDYGINSGVRSYIDGQPMDGVPSLRIHNGTDYASELYLIRWTEVFFLQSGGNKRFEVDHSRLAEAIAHACCLALTPHLENLVDSNLTCIGLRVSLDSERVGYEVGGLEETLPSFYMNDLDSALIPVITCSASANQEGPVTLELVFRILFK